MNPKFCTFYSPTGVKKQFIQKHIKYIFPVVLLFSLLLTKDCMFHKSMKSLEMLLLLSFFFNFSSFVCTACHGDGGLLHRRCFGVEMVESLFVPQINSSLLAQVCNR